jgi:hypothetical protein
VPEHDAPEEVVKVNGRPRSESIPPVPPTPTTIPEPVKLSAVEAPLAAPASVEIPKVETPKGKTDKDKGSHGKWKGFGLRKKSFGVTS